MERQGFTSKSVVNTIFPHSPQTRTRSDRLVGFANKDAKSANKNPPIISFPNSECSGGAKNGTCYTESECAVRGGAMDGACAAGYGVCCVCKWTHFIIEYIYSRTSLSALVKVGLITKLDCFFFFF